MTPRSAFVTALVLALIGWAAFWFFSNFERVEVEKNVGLRGEASVNDLLAAQYFLQATGMQAKSVEGLGETPPTDGTLIIPTERFEMGDEQAQELLHWVKQGGNLVVTVPRRYREEEEDDDDDPLLDPLGAGGVSGTWKGGPTVPTEVDLPQAGDFLQVEMCPSIRLESSDPEPELSLSDEYGIYLLRYVVGRGHVTILSSTTFMTNDSIGRFDHAAFLWHLAHDQNQGPVWLVYKDTMPSLFGWLALHAWQVLVSGALLLVVWLWAASRRFGPLLPPPPLVRRRLLDHIEASGRFLWRHGHAERLLKGVRNALFRTLELRHPAWANLPSQELYRRLAGLSRLSANDIQLALLYTHTGSEHEFAQVIHTLEQVRKSL
jgi:hypothetical protein